MIIYEHLTVCSRLLQWKGTVIPAAFSHLVVGQLMCGIAYYIHQGKPAWGPDLEGVDPLAWQLLMFPLGFLLGLRSDQAYGRYQEGADRYVELVTAGSELCRQASSYIKTDGVYRNALAGTRPVLGSGNADCDDLDRVNIFRHVLAFVAAVRQDIRLKRVGIKSGTIDELLEQRMHLTTSELEYLHAAGVFDEGVNTPLVISRWLSHDIARVVDRVVSLQALCNHHSFLARTHATLRADRVSPHSSRPWITTSV